MFLYIAKIRTDTVVAHMKYVNINQNFVWYNVQFIGKVRSVLFLPYETEGHSCALKLRKSENY